MSLACNVCSLNVSDAAHRYSKAQAPIISIAARRRNLSRDLTSAEIACVAVYGGRMHSRCTLFFPPTVTCLGLSRLPSRRSTRAAASSWHRIRTGYRQRADALFLRVFASCPCGAVCLPLPLPLPLLLLLLVLVLVLLGSGCRCRDGPRWAGRGWWLVELKASRSTWAGNLHGGPGPGDRVKRSGGSERNSLED